MGRPAALTGVPAWAATTPHRRSPGSPTPSRLPTTATATATAPCSRPVVWTALGNDHGELGNGTTGGPDGEAGYDTPQAVTGITDAVSVTSDNYGNGYGNCAVLSLVVWTAGGYNVYGERQRDDRRPRRPATTPPRRSPGSLTQFRSPAQHYGAGYGDYCAVLADRRGGLLGVQRLRSVRQRDDGRARN